MHGFVPWAFLPDAEVDAVMARLASEPALASDLAAAWPDDRRRLVRTLLWLSKFDLVGFDPDPGAA